MLIIPSDVCGYICAIMIKSKVGLDGEVTF